MVDNLINHSREAYKRLPIYPISPARLPRNLKTTKREVKAIYAADENVFWEVLATLHESLSGHIRDTFEFDRTKIKIIRKELASEKFAQQCFNRILAGGVFKSLVRGRLTIPLCPGCEEYDCTWEHFVSCFRLDEIPKVVLRNPQVTAELARALVNLETEIANAPR